jgi:hypothetical protein
MVMSIQQSDMHDHLAQPVRSLAMDIHRFD